MIAATFNWARYSDVRIGDWLQFFGAAAGSGIAVVGALWTESHWRRAALKRDRRLVLAHLNHLYKLLNKLILDAEFWEEGKSNPQDAANWVMLAFRDFAAAGGLLERIGVSRIERDFRALAALVDLEKAFDAFGPDFQKDADEILRSDHVLSVVNDAMLLRWMALCELYAGVSALLLIFGEKLEDDWDARYPSAIWQLPDPDDPYQQVPTPKKKRRHKEVAAPS